MKSRFEYPAHFLPFLFDLCPLQIRMDIRRGQAQLNIHAAWFASSSSATVPLTVSISGLAPSCCLYSDRLLHALPKFLPARSIGGGGGGGGRSNQKWSIEGVTWPDGRSLSSWTTRGTIPHIRTHIRGNVYSIIVMHVKCVHVRKSTLI